MQTDKPEQDDVALPPEGEHEVPKVVPMTPPPPPSDPLYERTAVGLAPVAPEEPSIGDFVETFEVESKPPHAVPEEPSMKAVVDNEATEAPELIAKKETSGWEADAWDAIEKPSSAPWRMAGAEEMSVAERPKSRPMAPESTRAETHSAHVLAQLVGISGGDAGHALHINQEEVLIGRGTDCDVVLRDGSASRHHARIVYDGSKFILVDLKSGNGTLVNGKRIDKQVLKPGDKVGFGKAVLRFEVLSASIDTVPEQILPVNRQRLPLWKTPWIGVAGGLALIVLVMYFGGRGGGDEAFHAFEQGAEAFKKREWDVARQHFQLVYALDPDNEAGRRYLDAIGKAEDATAQLKAARDAIAQQKIGEAVRLLDDLSGHFAWPEIREARMALEATVDSELIKTQGLLEKGRVDRARELLASLAPAAKDRPDFQRLQAWASMDSLGESRTQAIVAMVPAAKMPELTQTHAPVAKAQPSQEPKPKAVPAPKPSAPSAPESGRMHIPAPSQDAVAMFVAGDAAGAIRELRDLVDDNDPVLSVMRDYFDQWEQGMEAYRDKRTEVAIARFTRARSIGLKLARDSDPLMAQINQRLADMHYVQGVARILAGNAPEGYKSLKSALALAPDHRGVSRKIAELRGQAETMYSNAVVDLAQNPKSARSVLEMLVDILPSGDPIRRRAETDLQKL